MLDVSSFEERLAAARAAETAATTAASRAKDQAPDEAAAARFKAFHLKPAVEDAVAAAAALPLPAPYKATEFHRRRNRQDPLLEERIGLFSVYLIEDFQKPRIGKNRTVTPSDGISRSATAWVLASECRSTRTVQRPSQSRPLL